MSFTSKSTKCAYFILTEQTNILSTISTDIQIPSSSTHEISTTTPKHDITSTTSLTHTTTTTMQSSTGDNNTTTLIAAVISTVVILLVVSILVIIIVSVLMYKRRKRLTLEISTGGDGNHVYIDTSTMRKDEGEKGKMSNPTYQPQSTYTLIECYYQHYILVQ